MNTQFEKEGKLLYFQYFLKGLFDWYARDVKTGANDLSVLKVTKLLFFGTAVNSISGSQNLLISRVFNNFVAMPFGPVESEIYSMLKAKNGSLEYFTIDNKQTLRTQAHFDFNLSPDVLTEIDFSISMLQAKNPDLIRMKPFELVDLSHEWYSWKKNYAIAKRCGFSSHKIDKEDIINEIKIFSLA
jgi:uncharacterized phage-associated protein